MMVCDGVGAGAVPDQQEGASLVSASIVVHVQRSPQPNSPASIPERASRQLGRAAANGSGHRILPIPARDLTSQAAPRRVQPREMEPPPDTPLANALPPADPSIVASPMGQPRRRRSTRPRWSLWRRLRWWVVGAGGPGDRPLGVSAVRYYSAVKALTDGRSAALSAGAAAHRRLSPLDHARLEKAARTLGWVRTTRTRSGDPVRRLDRDIARTSPGSRRT